jgi:hypothetical protein
VRNDSSINLSTRQYVQTVKPYDERVLAPYNGWIHFCGKANWWQALLEIPNLKGINPYQGEFFDLYSMFAACERAGVAIIQWTRPLDARCRERIRTGFSRLYWAENYEDACRARDHLHGTGHVDTG